MANALANHFGEGFSANFLDDYAPAVFDSPADTPAPDLPARAVAQPANAPAPEHPTDPRRQLGQRFDNIFSSHSATRSGGDFDAYPDTGPDADPNADDDTFSDAFAEAFPAGFNEASFDQQLARQFGDFSADSGGPSDERGAHALEPRPLGMRGLHWLRRNMTSLRVIVSLQRVTPPEPPEFRPRKDPRNGTL